VSTAGVLGDDEDVEGECSEAVLVDQATKGVVTLNTDGSFTYVPGADFDGTDKLHVPGE
jgi:hypothetical protein